MPKIKVTVERIDGHCSMPMLVGDTFFIDDYKLFVPDKKYICMWALQSMIPLFPLIAERENLAEDHWARCVSQVACPDPKGRVLYRLERIGDDPR